MSLEHCEQCKRVCHIQIGKGLYKDGIKEQNESNDDVLDDYEKPTPYRWRVFTLHPGYGLVYYPFR